MWKRLSNPRNSSPSSEAVQPSPAQPKCLHWTPYLSASRSGNYNFLIPSYSAKPSISTVQSRPTLCVCILLRQEEKETNKSQREQISGTCHTWSEPKPTHRRSGGPFLSGGPRGSHGHIAVERTYCGARPLHWVGKGGQLLTEDFLTNFDHVLNREAGSLWNKSYIITTSITGSASATGHVIRNIPRQDMPEQWLPWEKMHWTGQAITECQSEWCKFLLQM